MQSNNLQKILIVDDEPADRILLRKILSKNYVIAEASDGEEAADLAHSEKPDLILMDIMMPKVDGYNACYRIKQDPLTAEIPVVMLTGLNHELNVSLAEKMGATGYLTKSLEPRELLDRIGELLCSNT
jgi:putative two-component system response regulator